MKCTTCGQENPALCNHPKRGALPAVTRTAVKYRPLAQTNSRLSWKLLAISTLVAVIAGVVLMTLAGLRAQKHWEARGHFDRTVTLEPLYSQDYHLTSLVDGPYELDVSAHDGPVLVACGMVLGDAGKVDPAEVKALLEKGVRVEKGKRHRLKGNYSRGKFYWTVCNPSADKPVDVTIRFNS